MSLAFDFVFTLFRRLHLEVMNSARCVTVLFSSLVDYLSFERPFYWMVYGVLDLVVDVARCVEVASSPAWSQWVRNTSVAATVLTEFYLFFLLF